MKAENKTTSCDSTARALMPLLHDLEQATEQFERIRLQLVALAARHGVPVAPAA